MFFCSQPFVVQASRFKALSFLCQGEKKVKRVLCCSFLEAVKLAYGFYVGALFDSFY